MSTDPSRILEQLRSGDRATLNVVMPQIYEQLRQVAHAYLGNASPNKTIQPTILVHEAYCKLLGNMEANPEDRTHFFALAAKAMRQVLLDHIKGRKREKRGGGLRRQPLSFVGELPDDAPIDAIDVCDALEELSKLDPRGAEIVELRFFGGLTEVETAKHLGISERTVRNDLRTAKAWLRCRLEDPST